MNRKNAFTLTELIVVIAIITILSGLLMPALGRARAKARQVKCVSTIASLETALAMYATDYGLYPPSAEGGGATSDQHNGNSHDAAFDGSPNNLIAALTSFEEGGPYMSFKGKELLDNGGNDSLRYVLKDPWSQAYVYVCQKAVDGTDVASNRGPFHPHAAPDKDHNTYNIYSLGEDKVTNGGVSYSDAGGSDWDLNTMFDNSNDGDWSSTTNQSDGQYDDINSWDGPRSG